jgi:NAD(P)H dehydrogenase (quinone)
MSIVVAGATGQLGRLVVARLLDRGLAPDEIVAAGRSLDPILVGAGMDEATAGFVVALDGNIRDGALADASPDLSRLAGRPSTPLVDALRALA